MTFSLPHEAALLQGTLVARYVRFIAEIDLDDGRRVLAHCVNPGRMEGQVRPGARVCVVPAAGPKRKLKFTWVLMEEHGEWVGVDTRAPNAIVGAALTARALPGFRRYRALRSEVKSGDSRIDFLLEGRVPHYLEVKNAHLVYPDGRAYFPDSVSARARGHLEHLADLVRAGARATALFVVQRHDAPLAARPSRLHDPEFAAAAIDASRAGVRFKALHVRPTLAGYEVRHFFPVDLRPYDPSRQEAWREALASTSGWKRR